MSGNPKPSGLLGLPGLEFRALKSACYCSQANKQCDSNTSFMLISTFYIHSRTSDRFQRVDPLERVFMVHIHSSEEVEGSAAGLDFQLIEMT